ncbi:hypothetical protein MTBUT4_200036 [Magnetospirillum sp. UT-4]|nr:hypothetical protein MTBUT4_200036 [Magnetospirillum sp. UT-4]
MAFLPESYLCASVSLWLNLFFLSQGTPHERPHRLHPPCP